MVHFYFGPLTQTDPSRWEPIPEVIRRSCPAPPLGPAHLRAQALPYQSEERGCIVEEAELGQAEPDLGL